MTGADDTAGTDLPPDVMQALRAGHKIEAIKRLREARGMGLKEAKDAVEAVKLPQTPDGGGTVERGGGATGLGVIALVLLGALAAYLWVTGG